MPKKFLEIDPLSFNQLIKENKAVRKTNYLHQQVKLNMGRDFNLRLNRAIHRNLTKVEW